MAAILDLRGKLMGPGDKIVFLPSGPVEFEIMEISDVIVATGPNQGRKMVMKCVVAVPTGPVQMPNAILVEKADKKGPSLVEAP
jgi:hypothetical protein